MILYLITFEIVGIEQHCSKALTNGTDDSCFTICLFQVDADGPTLELFHCAMENKCINLQTNTTVTDRVQSINH
jgi:hypothetical protein